MGVVKSPKGVCIGTSTFETTLGKSTHRGDVLTSIEKSSLFLSAYEDDTKMVGMTEIIGPMSNILRRYIDLDGPALLLTPMSFGDAPREKQKFKTMLHKQKQTCSEKSQPLRRRRRNKTKENILLDRSQRGVATWAEEMPKHVSTGTASLLNKKVSKVKPAGIPCMSDHQCFPLRLQQCRRTGTLSVRRWFEDACSWPELVDQMYYGRSRSVTKWNRASGNMRARKSTTRNITYKTVFVGNKN